MAEYTPDAATQAALAKSRTGAKLNLAEQQLVTANSKAIAAQMSSGYNGYGGSNNIGPDGTGGTGSPSQIDPSTGQMSFSPTDQAGNFAKYQNFIQSEQDRRSQGLPPRPLPSTFTSFLSTQNPLGYKGTGDVMQMKTSPSFNSMGVATNQGSLKYQPVLPTSVYNAGDGQRLADGTVTPVTPQQNPGVGSSAPAPIDGSGNFNSASGTPSALQTIHTPNGGLALGNSVAGGDEGKILAEAELQKQLSNQTLDSQTSGRAAMLKDLSTALQKQQQGALSDQMPGILEDLNTRGLLRSSALGEKVGLENAKLSRQTGEQFALQGIQDRNASINGMGTIESNYEGARSGALQRRFSLEDFQRQLDAGKALGANALPQVSQPSAKGASGLQGALGGATVGASVGGPTGAAVGGAIGLIGGSKLGSK